MGAVEGVTVPSAFITILLSVSAAMGETKQKAKTVIVNARTVTALYMRALSKVGWAFL
jgi:hypothetical protein